MKKENRSNQQIYHVSDSRELPILIHKDVITKYNIKGNELLLYCYISANHNYQGLCIHSKYKMCQVLNLTKATVKKAIDGLIEKKLVLEYDIASDVGINPKTMAYKALY